MLITVFLIGIASFLIAYKIYGDKLNKKYDILDKNKTPAHTMRDGVDYVPARVSVLFGHHFSSIAGAGPIVGPILAASLFGWLPAVIWIILGAIFIGGVHDFSAIVASIRHKARSIAEIAKDYISKNAYLMFLIFIWLSLVYVLIVFLDLTATTFALNGGVATASIIYIALAILFGFSLYKMRLNLAISTIIFVLFIFLSVWFGNLHKLTIPGLILNDPKKTWGVILLTYAFIASVTPVWILLQPRDYLSSFLLYSSVLVGIIGILFGGFNINYPAFTKFSVNNQTLFPILFVTIACGAISGFHSLVSSGTTSKQLNKETDARKIGYGAMLMEGVVALIALSTIMILSKDSSLIKTGGLKIYGKGIGNFLGVLGIKHSIGETFGLLVLSTFLLTTLDTATRLARYVLQELFSLEIKRTRFFATFITLILPAIFALITLKDPQGRIIPAWKAIWPVFGATNQLLAALTLLVISVWLIKTKKNALFTIIPLIFMLVVTLTALIELLLQYKFTVIGIIAGVLLLLALYLIVEAYRTLKKIKISY